MGFPRERCIEALTANSSLDAATDYLLNNPVPPPSLRQASSSGTGNADPAPAAPASGALAGGSSAPVASRPTGGNGNGGEQDELMRAIALSLSENITEAPVAPGLTPSSSST